MANGKKTQAELREAAKKAGKKAYQYGDSMYMVDTNKKVTNWDNYKASLKLPGHIAKKGIKKVKSLFSTIDKKKLGGFRNTGADWIESSNISIDD